MPCSAGLHASTSRLRPPVLISSYPARRSACRRRAYRSRRACPEQSRRDRGNIPAERATSGNANPSPFHRFCGMNFSIGSSLLSSFRCFSAPPSRSFPQKQKRALTKSVRVSILPNFLSSKSYPSSRRSHRSSRLEALPAKHGPPLRWPKRNRSLFSALRARCLRFCSHRGCISTAAAPASTLRAFGLAALAALRFVLESFIGEKHLFASCKYKLGTAFRTLQHPLVEFHERSPWDPFRAAGKGRSCTLSLGQ